MVTKLLIAWLVMALCVALHAIGLTTALRLIKRRTPQLDAGFWFATWLVIRIAGWIVLLHLLQIGIWALLYAWQQGLPDLYSAIYFSAVTYTTTGYGDLVLPREWQLVGGIEALTGILMCGLSTGFFFAVVSRLLGIHPAPETH
jgi:hypothetical protein